jgi:hypothetical protein
MRHLLDHLTGDSAQMVPRRPVPFAEEGFFHVNSAKA